MISFIQRPKHRLFVEQDLKSGCEVSLAGPARRHAAALRLHEGDEVILFNGQGGEFTARLDRIGPDRLVAQTLSWQDVERESPLSICLALGISAGDRMDHAVQKATELGVAAIQPLTTQRCVVRLDEPRAERRLQHWRAVAVSACEQCGRNRIPAIAPITALDELLQRPPGETRLLLDPGGDLRMCDVPRGESLVLLIGPEGGLSEEERRRAVAASFLPIRFGPRTLRTETAPVAALAALQALRGDC